MSKYIINGGYKLYGEIAVPSAKNSILPILASTILCQEKVTIHKCPHFADIENMCAILSRLGIFLTWQGDTLLIDGKNAKSQFIPVAMAKSLRSSIFTLGALLGRFGKARVAYPGGCDIGLRPIDLHLKGLRNLGVSIVESHGIINCDAKNLHSEEVLLDYPSVGATENIMLCAVLCQGTTTIVNCAKEPEIIDLQNFLNAIGGKVSGAGSDVITITGVKKLHSASYQPIGDRIIAGTYLIACAISGGEITVTNVAPNNLSSLINKLRNSGCQIICKSDKITIKSEGALNNVALIETLPYPGFPTDLQAQLLTLQTVGKGCCVVIENLFESRYKFVPELIKMGANVTTKGRTAVVNGVPYLSGAEVYAQDLRGGAALVLAGLCARGYTTVHDIHHIERGYCELDKGLSSLGAHIHKEL